MALPDHRVPEGHPAVAADPVAKDRWRPEAALEIQAQMVAPIAQMKMMRTSAIPIASDPSLEFRARPDLGVSAALPEWTHAHPWAPEHFLSATPLSGFATQHAKC